MILKKLSEKKEKNRHIFKKLEIFKKKILYQIIFKDKLKNICKNLNSHRENNTNIKFIL